MPRTRPPTQSDVARRAGVSQALVSYVLNGSPNETIPEETRQRIRTAIAELGYVPDRSARSLRTRQTHTLAVVLPDITNPYHPAFARGVQDCARRSGYDLIIYNTDGEYEQEKKVLEWVLQYNVDGLIGAFQHLQVAELERLTRRGIAVVLTEWYEHAPAALPLTFVGIDNHSAAQQAVTHLLGQGRRRIAHLRGIPGSPPAEARLAGYRQALAQAGLPWNEELVQPGDFSLEGGFRGAQALLRLPQPPDALFASNDLSAIGALDAIQQAGLRCPEEICVIGFDDIPAASIVRPRLSTIRPFQRQIGERAAQILIDHIHQPPPAQEQRLVTPVELILRDSA